MITTVAILVGFVLDLCLGERFSRISPAVLIGKLISALEPPMRNIFPATRWGERAAGSILVICVCVISFGIPAGVLWVAYMWCAPVGFVLEAFWCYQLLAVCGMRDASMAVYGRLCARDIVGARKAVGMIVGRETATLDEQGVTKAAVESVAENTSDGAIAPLIFLLIGGAPLGMLYKAINTMDSMIGYRTPEYQYFGTAAARLDDLANLVPSRVSALLFVAVAKPLGLDARGAWRIWRRDHAKHPSPNSAQGESAVAGALGIELLGDAVYFGRVVHKETLGDALRAIEPSDIVKSNNMLIASSVACCAVGVAIRAAICAWGGWW